MKLSELKALLLSHEGMRLKPYRDTVGKLTIGVGRNLEDTGITQEEANYLLENDIRQAKRTAEWAFPWFRDLSLTRQAVVISMIFNLGIKGFRSFRRLIDALEHGDYARAALEMRSSKWARQVGDRAVELARMMKSDTTS